LRVRTDQSKNILYNPILKGISLGRDVNDVVMPNRSLPPIMESGWIVITTTASTTPIVEPQVHINEAGAGAPDRKFAVITESGFQLDLNNMETGKRYLVEYEGSKYEVMKNAKGELELYEIG